MEEELNGKGDIRTRVVEYDLIVLSGRKLIGYTLEVFTDFLRLAYVA